MPKPPPRNGASTGPVTPDLEQTQPYFTLEDTATEIARGLKPLGPAAAKKRSRNPYDSSPDADQDPLNRRRVDPERLFGTNKAHRGKLKPP